MLFDTRPMGYFPLVVFHELALPFKRRKGGQKDEKENTQLWGVGSSYDHGLLDAEGVRHLRITYNLRI